MEINTLIFTGDRCYFDRTFPSALRGVGDGAIESFGFYSNAVKNHLQEELERKFGSFPVVRIIICFFVTVGRRLTRMP